MEVSHRKSRNWQSCRECTSMSLLLQSMLHGDYGVPLLASCCFAAYELESRTYSPVWISYNWFFNSQVSENRLTGTLPPSFNRLAEIVEMHSFFPRSLDTPCNIKARDIEMPQIDCVSDNSDYQKWLFFWDRWFGDNQFTGTLPSEYANLTNLEWWYILIILLLSTICREFRVLDWEKVLEMCHWLS